MFIVRFIALILIVLGLMFLGADVITMLESGKEPVLRSVEAVVGLFAAGAMAGVHDWAAATIPGIGADVVNGMLSLPAFAVFGVLGILLAVVSQERDDLG